MSFDLQTIWTTAGAAAAALIVGYLFGFLQSVAPFVPSSGTVRNWVLVVLSGALVALAGITSGHTLSDPDVVTNVFGGFLVFLGLYNMAKNAHGAGERTAIETSDTAKSIPTTLAAGTEVNVAGSKDKVIIEPSPPGPEGIEGGDDLSG